MIKPYTETTVEESVVMRTLLFTTPDNNFVWHWDEEDRIVEAVEPTDWMFQFDNELPIPFKEPIFIKAGVIHRVIKGTGDLVVKVTKFPTMERINRL